MAHTQKRHRTMSDDVQKDLGKLELETTLHRKPPVKNINQRHNDEALEALLFIYLFL